MGEEKRENGACLDYKKEGRNYRSWKEEAFPAYESSLGSQEKSGREEVSVVIAPARLRRVSCIAWLGVGLSWCPKVNTQGEDQHERDIREKSVPLGVHVHESLRGHEQTVEQVRPHREAEK